jgi:integrase
MDSSLTLDPIEARRVTGRKENELTRRTYQRGFLYQRGKRLKVWVARWRENVILADGSQARKQRSVVLGPVAEIPSLRQARLLLEERLRPINSGIRRPGAVQSFRSFALGDWLELKLPTLKPSTRCSYQVALRRHLVPYFGDCKLCDISRAEIQHYVNEMLSQGRAWQTVHNVWSVLSSVLQSAVEYQYLDGNPARGVRFPPQPPVRERRILNPNDVERLLARLREPFRTMAMLAVLTGLRIGELLALRWRSLDLLNSTLRVSESVYNGAFQQPKSRTSVRTIPLGSICMHALRCLRGQTARGQPEDLIFARRDGKPYAASYVLQRVLQPAAVSAGLGRVTWHQLRHVHSTMLHDLGAPAKIVQEQLGHASLATTLNVYTHAVEETRRKFGNKLETLLFPSCSQLGGRDSARAALIH